MAARRIAGGNECPKKGIYFRSGVCAVKNRKWIQKARRWAIIMLIVVCMIGCVIRFHQIRASRIESPKSYDRIGHFFKNQMERAYFHKVFKKHVGYD